MIWLVTGGAFVLAVVAGPWILTALLVPLVVLQVHTSNPKDRG